MLMIALRRWRDVFFENKVNRECDKHKFEFKKSVVKLRRVHGGCLGVQSL